MSNQLGTPKQPNEKTVSPVEDQHSHQLPRGGYAPLGDESIRNPYLSGEERMIGRPDPEKFGEPDEYL